MEINCHGGTHQDDLQSTNQGQGNDRWKQKNDHPLTNTFRNRFFFSFSKEYSRSIDYRFFFYHISCMYFEWEFMFK